MNHTSRSLLTTLLVTAAMALAACGQPAASATPQPTPAPTSAPTSQPTNPPIAAPSPTKAPTLAPSPTPAPTQPPAAVSGGDLSIDQMKTIFESSFAAYPWRWRQSVVNKSTQETITGGVIEVQSSSRVHTVTPHAEVASNAVIESILITPTLYMKATGLPANVLARVGATEGQWFKVPSGSPLANYATYIYLLGNPAQLLQQLGFADLLKQANPNAKPYKLVGTETVGSVRTNVYEVKVSSNDTTVTYRTSVGVSDGRIYKMMSDGQLLTATTIIEYDPSIKIEPPVL
jgi:hypothetical protein